MVRWILACDRRTFDADTHDEQTRLWVLAGSFPRLTCLQAMAIVRGEWEMEQVDNTLVVTFTFPDALTVTLPDGRKVSADGS